ncbi:tetratricopeptide repeat protein [Bacteroidales bacterium OttesenSCG-928-L03]|nr:tetratricopeptide repeat protein [Bacteroidales bacterium OttesenSCG-928-L03]
MTKQEITGYSIKVNHALENGRLKEAFETLTYLVLTLQNWQLREKLFELEENYKRMLSFLTEGYPDPDRERISNDLRRSLYIISDLVEHELRKAGDSSFFYEKKRINQHTPQDSPADLIAQLEGITGKEELLSLLEEGTVQPDFEKEKEELGQKIFSSVWLSNPWNKEVKNAWTRVVMDPLAPGFVVGLIVSAATLSLLESFDEQKALLLIEAEEHPKEEIRQRALTGLVLFLRKYDKRLALFPSITTRLEHLQEKPSFRSGVKNIILQFILSKDTEEISRKIKEELMPKMMKMGPKLKDKFRIDDIVKDMGTEDKNPEWEKIIQDEGLQGDFQMISELQMEGADVMHSSFAHLKNYPFFNEVSNWFAPFRVPAHLAAEKELSDFGKILQASTMICNSDKYSFFLSIAQMPENYRKMMMGQFSMESSAVQEMLNEEKVNESKKISTLTRQYIQDLYRFYKLHPRRRDFEDVFDKKTELYEASSIFKIIDNPTDLYVIGEYYFKKNYFTQASHIFGILSEGDPRNDILYQKRGYSLQMMGDIAGAIDMYSKAELLNANNGWIIRKLAYCHRLQKNPEEALLYYKKAEKLNPDNLSVQLNIGHCYLELKDYDEALKCYFKVEYLDVEKNKPKAWRPIAWSSFLTGKYEQAQDYFRRIIEHGPNATDYLNAGHTQLALKNNKEAMRLYALSIKFPDNTLVKFTESFLADEPDLVQAGVNKEDIPLILDCLMYEV